jgi:membrane protein implicated in regulation of membrane protease activity
MWRAVAAGVAVVLAALSGLLTTVVSAHRSLGVWVALAVVVVVGAILQVAITAGQRRSRSLPSDHAEVSAVREAAERIREKELKAAWDGITWPALSDTDEVRLAKALNALGGGDLVRSWYRYLKAAQDHARLFRGRRTPSVAAEFSARGKANRAYSLLIAKLRRFEER